MPEVQSRSYANPRRLPRRNHYQEGPGFLFVATEGGRPPGDVAPRAQAVIVRRRRVALRRWTNGESIATICADLGCGGASLFRWRVRYEADGLDGLLRGPRIGRASELPPTMERLILTVRLLTYWKSRRIAAEFRRRSGRSATARSTGSWPATAAIARATSGRAARATSEPPSTSSGTSTSRGSFYLVGATGRRRTCHFVALVDDHSRFLLGIRAVPTKEAIWVLGLLEEAIELCGVPHELMSGNGTPFVAITRTMLSRFQRSLAAVGSSPLLPAYGGST
jgi:transposase